VQISVVSWSADSLADARVHNWFCAIPAPVYHRLDVTKKLLFFLGNQEGASPLLGIIKLKEKCSNVQGRRKEENRKPC
jgi:hypothetical protein